jgi:hypothetical protein
MLIDLDQQATQAAFGELVGIAQPSVSALMAEGKLPGAGTLRELLLATASACAAQAAGRMGENTTLDLVQERAALAREQREGQAIKNAVARREYAPIGLLSDVLYGQQRRGGSLRPTGGRAAQGLPRPARRGQDHRSASDCQRSQ